MNFTNPKLDQKWHTTYKNIYGGYEVNCSEVWNIGPKEIALLILVIKRMQK